MCLLLLPPSHLPARLPPCPPSPPSRAPSCPLLQVENFQIISPEGDRLENLVCLLPGLRVRACAACAPEAGATRTSVDIDQASACSVLFCAALCQLNCCCRFARLFG